MEGPITILDECVYGREFTDQLKGIQVAKPNILLLMTDQQRWDAMGCSGGWLETPNMDRIAKEGVRFSNCVTNSPICIPTRLSMATGHYPHNTGIWDNEKHHLNPEAPTWMQAVRNAGYRTSVFGKTHLHPHQSLVLDAQGKMVNPDASAGVTDLRDREPLLNAYGLDDVNEIAGPRSSSRTLSHMTAMWEEKGVWDAYREDVDHRFKTKPWVVRPSPHKFEDYADVYLPQQARVYLQNYNREEPWFCWVSFGGPHEPWDTPEPYASKYDPDSMPDPVPLPEMDRDLPKSTLTGKLETRSPEFEPGEEKLLRADYAGNLTLIDDQVGEILEAIEARGEMDNTVIIYCSDHGEMNGDYGMIYKANFLNGAVRVPLLIRTPETVGSAIAGKVCESMVEWFDVGPTLVELAGGELVHTQFAKSLCPVVADPTGEHRSEAISEYGGDVMLLDRQWKIALNQEGQTYLLFDVHNDPDELRNTGRVG